MSNLNDLNDHLFAQLDRLSNESLDSDNLHKEIARSNAVRDLAKEVISNAQLTLDATVKLAEWQIYNKPQVLGLDNDTKKA